MSVRLHAYTKYDVELSPGVFSNDRQRFEELLSESGYFCFDYTEDEFEINLNTWDKMIEYFSEENNRPLDFTQEEYEELVYIGEEAKKAGNEYLRFSWY